MACGNDIQEITLALTLIFVVVGGGLGGILDFFNRFNIQLRDQNNTICFQGAKIGFSQFISLGTMNSALGVGGALAVQFVMTSIGKFQKCETPEVLLLLFTISVVAGFGGRRFLSLVTSKLEDQIGEQSIKIEEVKVEAEEGLVIASAIATLSPSSTISERSVSIHQLENSLKKRPNDRRLAILIGRLYRRNGDLESSIGTLNNFLNTKKTRNETDVDYADALYNRACYKVLLSEQDPSAEKDLIKAAIDDLSTSVDIYPENATDAASDEDFSKIKDNDDFKKLITRR